MIIYRPHLAPWYLPEVHEAECENVKVEYLIMERHVHEYNKAIEWSEYPRAI